MTCYAFKPAYARGGCDQHLAVNRFEIEESISD